MQTATKIGDPKVTVTPAPNGRALVQMESRLFTLIDEVLTHEEIVALLSGLTGYVLNHAPAGSEYECEGGK
jgi:hypothetical protein